ncbi:hypothetical protein VNI00_011124 [Paramarasmius palmivorus]|uniref:Uncharacterized protein n=1 Tax=Paramarasmius palmivorus TaxID=297713 RepID=A0AAW0CH60_9AGAR
MARLQTDDVQQPQPQSPKFLKGSTASNRCGEPIEREAGEGDSGVFALQIDVERVSMWFWGSQDIPFSISQAKFREGMSVDISDWRGPSAVYPAVGHGQKLALGVTLCGDQAGEPEVHTETCLDPGVGESQCNHDPNSFTSAYWEISYIRTFTLHAARRKAGLFARAESGTNTTSSVDLLPSIHRSINIGPPHPTLFNPTVATTATSHSDGHHVIAETRQGTVPIFNPTITWTDDQRSTQAESAPVTFSIFNPVITDTQVDTAVSVTTSTSETGHTETDTVDITTAPTSSSEPTAEVASTVVDVTLASGSVRSVTLTVGEGGVGVVGATTTVNSVGFGVSGSTSTQTDATPPSGSTASSNAGSVARFGVDLLVVGFIFSVFAVNCCV